MNKIKSLAKKYLPERLISSLIVIWSRIKNIGIFRYDRNRYMKNYSDGSRRLSYEHIASRLIFHAHSIEKGLSHDNIRYGFGKSALKNLSIMMRRYNQQGFDKNKEPYINALSVLKAYIDLHKNTDHDISYLENLFGDLILEAKDCNSEIGGAINISYESKKENDTKNFKDLFMNRYSVRSYSDEPIAKESIQEAIDIAMKSPSICNRQSSRVRIVSSSDDIKKALSIQGGLKGYEEPPVLLVITTDSRDFVAVTERNQIWIDGGLFAMSLLLALEYKKLAACPLNTMFTVKQDRAVRKLLNLGPSENIIMFAAVGNFKEQINAPKSFRLNGKDITTVIN